MFIWFMQPSVVTGLKGRVIDAVCCSSIFGKRNEANELLQEQKRMSDEDRKSPALELTAEDRLLARLEE